MIELLYFEGCPHSAATLALIRDVLGDLGLKESVREVEVRDNEDAKRLRFPGSPTVRVNGVDIEPGLAERKEYALACRTYATSTGSAGVPPRELLATALGGMA